MNWGFNVFSKFRHKISSQTASVTRNVFAFLCRVGFKYHWHLYLKGLQHLCRTVSPASLCITILIQILWIRYQQTFLIRCIDVNTNVSGLELWYTGSTSLRIAGLDSGRGYNSLVEPRYFLSVFRSRMRGGELETKAARKDWLLVCSRLHCVRTL